MFHPYDNEVDHIATPAEAVDEWRFNVGPDNEGKAWLLHDRDVWVKNPYYVGPPVPHPEDEAYWDSVGFVPPAPEAPVDNWMPRNLDIADDIPF